METGFDRDFRIMDCRGFELDLGPARAAAKEVDRAATPDHLQRPLPGRRRSHGLNNRIRSNAPIRNIPDGRNWIIDFRYVPRRISAKPLGRPGLATAFAQCDNPCAAAGQHSNELQTNRSASDDYSC